MIRFFQFVILILGLSLVALASAIVTMRFAIHGAEVTVPSFKGMTAEEARNEAAELGVEMTIDNRFYSAEVPAGRIVGQSPVAGTVGRREWHVLTAESLGPQLVAIPSLVGQQKRAATMQLRRLGLELGTVAHMPYPSTSPGTVIVQDPGAGAGGVEKPGISLVVGDAASTTGAAFVMPNFVGLTYAAAAATISRTGLRLAPANGASGATGPLGTVVGQSPQAGYFGNETKPVELSVAR